MEPFAATVTAMPEARELEQKRIGEVSAEDDPLRIGDAGRATLSRSMQLVPAASCIQISRLCSDGPFNAGGEKAVLPCFTATYYI
jgi:hypothetical protein